MSANSTIEWTEKTWNPVAGCSKISPGCLKCYAETMANRLKGMAEARIAAGKDPGRLEWYSKVIGVNGHWNGKMFLIPEALAEPLNWPKTQMIFVNSMSDLFHENLSVDDIRIVCEVMSMADWHIFQVLTKRADRMAELLTGELRQFAGLPHVWWGTSVENKRHGLSRVDALRSIPAQTRFLSVEPLVEDLGAVDFDGIHWVIVGGESGTQPRPMSIDWVRPIRDHCVEKGIPFFFKQWGTRNKKAAGRLLDGRTWDEMPPLDHRPAPDMKRRGKLSLEMVA